MLNPECRSELISSILGQPASELCRFLYKTKAKPVFRLLANTLHQKIERRNDQSFRRSSQEAFASSVPMIRVGIRGTVRAELMVRLNGPSWARLLANVGSVETGVFRRRSPN